MIKFGNFIARHKKLIIAFYILMLVPAVFGYVSTRINYDVLSYLPDTLETVKGQEIMVDKFGSGAFSMIIAEDMTVKEASDLKHKIENVDHVKDVIWYDDAADISVPQDMIPGRLHDIMFSDNSVMMIALFDNTTSADETMSAVSQMRKITAGQCFISGMSGVVTDIKEIFLKEMPAYIVIAAVLSLIVLIISMDSFAVPFIFLTSIGAGILYNLGSNIFLGEISYITQALTAVLQLGVTMDYSIFLLNSYMNKRKEYQGDQQRAMAEAISETFRSVAGSSVTTIAGFAALMLMTFALGKNIGIVMMKGVVIGVICCVTLLPAMILCLEKLIDRTTHRNFIPSLDRVSDFITKHNTLWLLIFSLLFIPALYGNNNNELYYNIDSSLPETLPSAVANRKLEEEFNMNSVYLLMVDDSLSAKDKNNMNREIENIRGINGVIGIDSIAGPMIPESMIPEKLSGKLRNGGYEIEIVSSDYKTATSEANDQIGKVTDIVKSYSTSSLVVGEAPLTKDLADVTDRDLTVVNIVSIAAIFIIIMIAFRSVTLPFILVSVIEFAICINMSVPFYTNTPLPFVASIVIGTIQLGATVDYAILMTGKYQNERRSGKNKYQAVKAAHRDSLKPVLISGLSFFAATFGVGLYSEIDMISSITGLLSRGAVISTVVVLTVLPSMFIVFDRIICATTSGMSGCISENKVNKNKYIKQEETV